MKNLRHTAAFITAFLTYALLFFPVSIQAQSEDIINKARESAIAAEASLLAPAAWGNAETALQALNEDGAATDPVQTETTAALFDKAATTAKATATRLQALLAMRSRAIAAGAAETSDRNWEKSEKYLAKIAAAIERGSDQSQKVAQLLQSYDAAELAAIKSGILRRAMAAESLAQVGDARRYAPKTFGAAQSMLKETQTILDENRTNLDAARTLAAAAETEFKHATQISIAAARIRNARLSSEDIILEWEERLQVINSAAGKSYDPLESWDDVAEGLITYIESLNTTEQQLEDELGTSRNYIASLEEELRVMDERLGGTVAERDSLIFEQQEEMRRKEKLRQISESFSAEEAVILRRDGDIILRLQGMQFESGSAKLSNTALDLLARTASIIDAFPDATIMVEGHTDASGSPELNERLSQERADAVMRYMVRDLRIDGRRINSAGYGSSRPVGLNSTTAGRAKNRRIDIVITQDGGSPEF